MIDYDDQLQELALQAQQFPAKSAQRQIALTKFIQALRQSGKITRPKSGSFPGLYEDIYDEALQRLFMYICDRIETYDPKKGKVLQWVNFLLSRRFFNEASRDILPTLPRGVDARSVTCLSIDELERHDSTNFNPHLMPTAGEELREYIKNDPESLLRVMHVDKHPTVTFQFLLLKRLEKCSWKSLSQELDIPLPTLNSFYQRSLRKLVPKFKEYLS